MSQNDNLKISPTAPSFLVGLGASAGGLEALEKFFRATPIDTGMAFVVIQHLSPDFRSLMDELLARFTEMPVITIEERTPIVANTVYLLPPKKDAVVKGDVLIADDRSPGKQLSMPINLFMNSLSESWAEKAIGIILSGTGSDGSEGIASIRVAGGYTLVQDPASARFDGMPVSAISTGCVDKIANADTLPEVMLSLVNDPELSGRTFGDERSVDDDIKLPGVHDIYDTLNDHFSLDFKQYKPTTILRRIQRRATLGNRQLKLDDYAEKIKTVDDELHALYRDLLIGVTGFFRDADAYSSLDSGIIRKEIEALAPEQDYRVWVCGCSTGEEAYSLGMLLLETFDSLGRCPNLKVFATDVNKEYLNVASEGLYGIESIQDVPTKLRDKYFSYIGGGTYKVSQALRKIIIFSEHNLLKNPPFTRMNLVSCRNLLIYLRADAQIPAITSFNFSLVPGGLLFLGASETLGALADDFEVLDRQWKIYRKIRESSLSAPSRPAEHVGQLVALDHSVKRGESKNYLGRLYHSLLDKYIAYGMLLTNKLEVIDVFGQESLQSRSAYRKATDLKELVSDSVSSAIKTLMQKIQRTDFGSEVVCVSDVDDGSGAKVRVEVELINDKLSSQNYFSVIISPMPMHIGSGIGADRTMKIRDFSFPNDSLEFVKGLQSELMSAKEALQTNAEELETSNEELQSSNEELQASNEELQSTNEELHSVNEELYTVNTELELKIVELDKTSSDLRNLVDSTQVASVFLDGAYRIRVFTPLIQDVFGLVQSDIGRDLRDFTPKVIDPVFWQSVADAYSSLTTSEAVVYSKPPGKKILWRRVSAYRNTKKEVDGVLVTFVDMTKIRAKGLPLILQGVKSMLGLGR